MIKKIHIIYFICLSFLLSEFENQETGWAYEQSTAQAFHIFESIQIDGSPVEGDGCSANQYFNDTCYCFENPGTCDVVGAFYNNVCVGWTYAQAEAYETTVPVMGNDGSFSAYPNSDDIIEFKIYDATSSTILDLIPGEDIAPFQNNSIDVVYGASVANNVLGCTDESACNYNSDATLNDGSCEYPEENFDCDGNCVVGVDCLGECGGSAVVDECGVCDGLGIPDEECDCDGNVLDCAGVCGGSAEEDYCGVCDDDPSNDCDADCNGEFGGDALEDECGVCDNDSSNDCVQDCNDDWGGEAFLDECGVCSGGLSNHEENSDQDCLGICFGDAVIDECGICDGPGLNADGCCGEETLDCNDVCDGTSELDECGICDGPGLNADGCCGDDTTDCNGDCGGTAELDECGICDGIGAIYECGCTGFPDSEDCEDTGVPGLGITCEDIFLLGNNCEDSIQFGILVSNVCPESCGLCPEVCDCDGNVLDECGICNGPGLNVDGCCGDDAADCNGECGGTAELDDCGVCGGNNADQDCNGECFGSAIIDECGICNGDGLSCEVYIESSVTAIVDEPDLADIEVFEENFELLIESQLNLPEDSVEVISVTILRDIEVIVSYTITLTEQELAETDFSNEESIEQALVELEFVIEEAGVVFIAGCIDQAACNYDLDATINNGSCEYPEENFDCDGNCTADTDCNGDCGGAAEIDECGICGGDNSSCSGCMDELACNYNPDLIIPDNESCVYAPNQLDIFYTIDGNLVELIWEDPEGSPPFIYYYLEEPVESPLLINLEWSSINEIIISMEDASVLDCGLILTSIIIEIGEEPLPDAVTGFNAIPGEGVVALSWDEDNQTDLYNLYIQDSETPILVFGNSFVDDDLPPNTSYSYQIAGVNTQGNEGPLSEQIFATTYPLNQVNLDSVVPSQGSLYLNWSISSSNTYNGEYYKYDIYQDDIYIYTFSTYSYNLSFDYQVQGLSPNQEYCFTIIPKIEYESNDGLQFYEGISSNQLCGTPNEVTGWEINMPLSIQSSSNDQILIDSDNFIGMSPDATNFYDPIFDIPESMVFVDWASLYFPHPEWGVEFAGSSVENFNTDIRHLQDLSDNLFKWKGEIKSDVQGEAEVSFGFISESVNWPIYFKLEDSLNEDNFIYYNISHSDAISFAYAPPNQAQKFEVIVGDSNPGPPINLSAIGGPRRIDLSWENRQICIFDEYECNDIDNRYPATGYKIFRNSGNGGELKYLFTTSDQSISFDLDQLYVNYDETEISIVGYPQNGDAFIDCYESYVSINANGEYDIEEPFDDCGLDGLCPGDQGYDEEPFDDCGSDGVCPGDENYISPDLDGTEDNGSYDEGEPFIDVDGNGFWDQNGPDKGELDGICNRYVKYTPNPDFLGQDILTINNHQNQQENIIFIIDGDLPESYVDEGLIGGESYAYYILGYNNAGDSRQSSLVSDQTDPNILPIAEAGGDIDRYVYNPSVNQDSISVSVFLPENEDGTNNNYSYDPDAFDGEELNYSWEWFVGGEWQLFINSYVSSLGTINYDFPIGEHLFRLRVQDISLDWSDYDYVTVSVQGLPEPAKIDELNITQDLYYLGLDWDLSQYGENPDGYDGNPNLAAEYKIYRDDLLIATLDDVIYTCSNDEPCDPDSNDCGEGYCLGYATNNSYVDDNLSPDTEYCYDIYGVNAQGALSEAERACLYTGSQPTIQIISPNGGDILVAGSSYTMDLEINNSQFIDTLNTEIFYTQNSLDASSWELLDVDLSNLSSPTLNIPESEGITTDNLFKVKIYDKGNYVNENVGSYTDESDARFIIANNNLENAYNDGVNMIGVPLAPQSSLIVDNFPESVWGPFFNIFDGLGNNAADQNLLVGNGYYILNAVDAVASFSGEILTHYELPLKKGWNLISNPLVANLNIEDLKMSNDTLQYSWQEAIDVNMISPVIMTYDNLDRIHKVADSVDPFDGYWVYSSAEDSLFNLEFISLPYETEVVYNNPIDDLDWKMEIFASEEAPLYSQTSIRDRIVLGMNHDGQDGFQFGEDLYDIPVAISAKYANLYIDHGEDWNSYPDVESGRFMVDVRSGMQTGFKEWKIKGETSGSLSANSEINLSWSFDSDNLQELIGNSPITLFVGDYEIDMLNTDSIVILGSEFSDIKIHFGSEEELSNDDSTVSEFALKDLYPNPFNPTTTLNLSIPTSDNLNIVIYDVLGNQIETLYDGFIESGQHQINWHADSVSSGVYFFKTTYKNNIIVKKAILIK